MAGNRTGGLKVKAFSLKKDPDYYKKIGALGGSSPKTKPSGFAYVKLHNPEKLSEVGRRGGSVSKRRKKAQAV